MKKIVLLSHDQKASTQAALWVRDLREEIVLERFNSYEELAKAYDLAGAEARGEGDPPPRVGPIHILVADADALPSPPVQRLRQARKAMQDRDLIDPALPLGIIAMAYEPGEASADGAARDGQRELIRSFRDECVDDLILKPLDRSLFLQKIEILLAEDPLAATPSFLFKQKTSLMVEMGKESAIDRVGESGFAIRNPVPLMNGVFARIYCDIFGPGPESGLYGRVFKSERHPDRPGQYLVYFSYFGATHEQTQRVRKFVRKHEGPHERGPSAASERAAKKPKSGAQEKKNAVAWKNVAVIDVDPTASSQLAEALEENFENLRAHRFPSYSAFLGSVKKRAHGAEHPGASEQADDPAMVDIVGEAFPGEREQAFIIDANSLDVLSAMPPILESEQAFGASGDVLRDRPGEWLQAFAPAEAENLREFVNVVAAGRSAGQAVRVRLAGGAHAFLRIRGRREKAADGEGAARLRLDMKQIDAKEFARLMPGAKAEAMTTVDGIFIDESLISADALAWFGGMREALAGASLARSDSHIPTIVVADEESSSGPARFRYPEFCDFAYRPFDRRAIVEQGALAITGLIPKPGSPAIEFFPCAAFATIAKDVEIDEFSEYGATLKHKTPLRSDAFVALFGGTLTGEDYAPVWARCTHCAKASKEDAFYRCFFRFFGISEEVLRRIRSWIREDYVSKKDAAA